LETELRSADRTHIAAGTSPDDGEIIGHENSKKKSDHSAEAQQFRLFLRFFAKAIRAEINLVARIVKPEDRVSVVGHRDLVEVSPVPSKIFKHFAVSDYRSQIDDALIPVVENEFHYSVDDRRDGRDARQKSAHFSRSKRTLAIA